jgi:hypothetical protein
MYSTAATGLVLLGIILGALTADTGHMAFTTLGIVMIAATCIYALIQKRRSYRSYASFRNPDGNSWLFQEVTARLPGRVDADVTTFTSPAELERALRRAEAAHGEHKKRTTSTM